VSIAQGKTAVHAALDLGITWFDTAPPYGDGEAEAVLGEALKSVRQEVVVCTKVGIEPPVIPFYKRLLRPVARGVIKALPSIRNSVSRARSHGVNQPIAPNALRRSVERSLQRLQTDYIDVLALHEPHIEDCANKELFGILEDLKKEGKILEFSIAGSVRAIEVAKETCDGISTCQFPISFFDPATVSIIEDFHSRGLFCITHSVLAGGQIEALSMILAREPKLATRVACALGIEGEISAASVLLGFALISNPSGSVVMSMFSTENLQKNVTTASHLNHSRDAIMICQELLNHA
jgi:aryl-alcohol dehydrogenase-like predicted oxidoreductase